VTVGNLADIGNLSLYDDGRIGRGAYSRDSSFWPVSVLGAGSTTLDVHGDDGDVRVGANAHVGPFGDIGQGVRIGRGAQVHANVNLGANVRIGANAVVCPGQTVDDETVVPRGATHPPEGCGVTIAGWRDWDGDGTGNPAYGGVFSGSTLPPNFAGNDLDCDDADGGRVGGQPSCLRRRGGGRDERWGFPPRADHDAEPKQCPSGAHGMRYSPSGVSAPSSEPAERGNRDWHASPPA
jgi:hypothetical protein